MGFRPEPGWNEEVFRVPSRLIEDGDTELVLQGRYTSYFYWFFQ
jgi:hypothetical protein